MVVIYVTSLVFWAETVFSVFAGNLYMWPEWLNNYFEMTLMYSHYLQPRHHLELH